MGVAEIEVRRSRRRTKTVQAFRENGRTVVAIPDRFTAAEEAEWVARMVQRLERTGRRRRPSDTELAARAQRLSDRYLDGLARPQADPAGRFVPARAGLPRSALAAAHRIAGLAASGIPASPHSWPTSFP